MLPFLRQLNYGQRSESFVRKSLKIESYKLVLHQLALRHSAYPQLTSDSWPFPEVLVLPAGLVDGTRQNGLCQDRNMISHLCH